MSSVVIKGDTSGQVTLAAPAVAGTVTVTLPSASATMATNVNGDLYPLTSGTAVASTSGTSIDFTSIPSWVKRVTVVFSGVSTNGTSNLQVQIGSGSVQTTGYVSGVSEASTNAFSTSAFLLRAVTAAALTYNGTVTLVSVGSNVWVESGVIANSASNSTGVGGGNVTLSGTLDRVRITTAGGTDTFDAGSINILYE
jgi:hypothetical protein